MPTSLDAASAVASKSNVMNGWVPPEVKMAKNIQFFQLSSISMNFPIFCERSDVGRRESPCCEAEEHPTSWYHLIRGPGLPKNLGSIGSWNKLKKITISDVYYKLRKNLRGGLGLVLLSHINLLKDCSECSLPSYSTAGPRLWAAADAYHTTGYIKPRHHYTTSFLQWKGLSHIVESEGKSWIISCNGMLMYIGARSVLVTVWSPREQQYIDKIEDIQRIFICKIYGM